MCVQSYLSVSCVGSSSPAAAVRDILLVFACVAGGQPLHLEHTRLSPAFSRSLDAPRFVQCKPSGRCSMACNHPSFVLASRGGYDNKAMLCRPKLRLMISPSNAESVPCLTVAQMIFQADTQPFISCAACQPGSSLQYYNIGEGCSPATRYQHNTTGLGCGRRCTQPA